MKFDTSQFSHPKGIVGHAIGVLMSNTNQARNTWVIDLLDVQPSDRILEVGFGSGTTVQQISRLAMNGFVAGIDHSAAMVRQASYHNASAIRRGQIALVQGSDSFLPYDNLSFDKAFTSNCHFFWSQPVESLREVHRVLEPGGQVILSWQPLWAKNAEGIKESTEKAVQDLASAEFKHIRLKFKPMRPVISICAIGVK